MQVTEKTPVESFDPLRVQTRSKQMLDHDIRAALSGVLGGLDLLELDDFSLNNKENYFRAKASAKMLLMLLDSENSMIGREPKEQVLQKIVNFDREIQCLTSRWTSEAKANDIKFQISGPDHEIELEMRFLDFHRVFNNLIGNSIKFTKQGAVIVDFSVAGDRLFARIIDSGEGFSDQALENLFAFQGRPDSADKAGAGLGLFIAKSLVEAAGGTINAKNKVNGGAEVSVSLPCEMRQSQPVSRVGEDNIAPELPNLSYLNILLAEDNLTNQLVAKKMLKSMNARCDVAADGIEAMQLFEQNSYDVALIDIEMPRMSGLEVMREIRKRKDKKAAIPLIALTAYVLPEHQERISAAGASGLISKPLTNIAEFGLSILAISKLAPAVGSHNSHNPVAPQACIDRVIYDGLAEMIGAESMQELLEKVKTDIENVKTGVAEGLRQKDNSRIGSETHILISVAGAIGAVPLQNLAQSLNSLSKTTNWQQISDGVENCVSKCSEVLDFVETRLRLA